MAFRLSLCFRLPISSKGGIVLDDGRGAPPALSATAHPESELTTQPSDGLNRKRRPCSLPLLYQARKSSLELSKIKGSLISSGSSASPYVVNLWRQWTKAGSSADDILLSLSLLASELTRSSR